MISNYYILLTMLICLMASSASAGDDKNTLNDPVTPDGLVRPKAAKPLQNTEHQKLGLALNLCRVSDVVGKKVENEHGENLGKIEDVVLDASRGQIVYAVLSFGGILGIGDKLFAIPWTALKDQPGKKFCLLSVDKDLLKKAPGFDKSNWPDFGNAKWSQGIHEFYGVQLHGDDYSSQFDLDFGDAEPKREAVKLPLELKQGESYRYLVTSHPGSDATLESSRPASAAKAAGMEVSFQVVKVRAGEATVEASCNALGVPVFSRARKDEPVTSKGESCTFNVRSDGQIVFPVKDAVAGETEKLPVDKANAHVKAHVNHIFGYRLHDSMLEPAKEYTMPASIHELLGHDSAGSAGQHQMRYEGTTSLDGRQTARFVILLDVSKKASSTAGREVGRAAYRVDDGLLERLVLGSTSIRRIAITVGDAGN